MALSAEVAVELRQLERHVETLSGTAAVAALTAVAAPALGRQPPPPGSAQLTRSRARSPPCARTES
jgi:hypothetical protein